MNVIGLVMMFVGGLIVYYTLSTARRDSGGLPSTPGSRGQSGLGGSGSAGGGGAGGGGGSF